MKKVKYQHNKMLNFLSRLFCLIEKFKSVFSYFPIIVLINQLYFSLIKFKKILPRLCICSDRRSGRQGCRDRRQFFRSQSSGSGARDAGRGSWVDAAVQRDRLRVLGNQRTVEHEHFVLTEWLERKVFGSMKLAKHILLVF